jgi:hypothetical protein
VAEAKPSEGEHGHQREVLGEQPPHVGEERLENVRFDGVVLALLVLWERYAERSVPGEAEWLHRIARHCAKHTEPSLDGLTPVPVPMLGVDPLLNI